MDTGIKSSSNLKFWRRMRKTTHLSDEPLSVLLLQYFSMWSYG